MTRLFAYLVAAVVMAGFASGCSGDKDKGINSNKDKPRPAAMEPK